MCGRVRGASYVMKVALTISKLVSKYKIPFIFKSSYKKANRSRPDSFTSIGDEKGLGILKKVSEKFNIPVLPDVHSPEEAILAAKYVDVLQIPAFLAWQTELLVASAETGKWVNIKKVNSCLLNL